MKLEGKKVLVTGAGAGIGRAIAGRFAREGAELVVSDISREAGEQTAQSIRKSGGQVHFVLADVRREADVENLVKEVASRLGGLQILVNNAGIELIKPIVELTEEEWDRLMSVNVKGVFFGCKHALPVLQRSGGGSVINVASAAGLIGWPLLSAYCASKGAVVLLTKSLAQEYKGSSLRFNAICPMLVETELARRFIDCYEKDYGIPIVEGIQGRQTRLATVEEVAAAATFLASDESSFVNGHSLVLDNGGLSG